MEKFHHLSGTRHDTSRNFELNFIQIFANFVLSFSLARERGTGNLCKRVLRLLGQQPHGEKINSNVEMQKGMQRKLKRTYVCIRSPQREKRNTNVYMSKGE